MAAYICLLTICCLEPYVDSVFVARPLSSNRSTHYVINHLWKVEFLGLLEKLTNGTWKLSLRSSRISWDRSRLHTHSWAHPSLLVSLHPLYVTVQFTISHVEMWRNALLVTFELRPYFLLVNIFRAFMPCFNCTFDQACVGVRHPLYGGYKKARYWQSEGWRLYNEVTWNRTASVTPKTPNDNIVLI
jgi:hypothetical protein